MSAPRHSREGGNPALPIPGCPGKPWIPAFAGTTTLSLLVFLLLLPTHAGAASPTCPAATEITPQQLVGLWRAELNGQAQQGATLLLEPHREYAQSLSGEINRDGSRARVAADLEEGEFTLEESADGQRITATWLGDVVEGSCGKEIRGRREGGWDGIAPFVLRKLP